MALLAAKGAEMGMAARAGKGDPGEQGGVLAELIALPSSGQISELPTPK